MARSNRPVIKYRKPTSAITSILYRHLEVLRAV